MPDITGKILNDLDQYANGTAVGAQPDLTTWLARKLGQDRVLGATSEATLYDGDDIVDDLRTYLNGVADY